MEKRERGGKDASIILVGVFLLGGFVLVHAEALCVNDSEGSDARGAAGNTLLTAG